MVRCPLWPFYPSVLASSILLPDGFHSSSMFLSLFSTLVVCLTVATYLFKKKIGLIIERLFNYNPHQYAQLRCNYDNLLGTIIPCSLAISAKSTGSLLFKSFNHLEPWGRTLYWWTFVALSSFFSITVQKWFSRRLCLSTTSAQYVQMYWTGKACSERTCLAQWTFWFHGRILSLAGHLPQ